ncbi:unnamed protein product [Cunninghamella blakesleeana]
MDIIPNEIIIKIFQYLPQRYISNLSTVCKQWNNIIQQPNFLNTIEIYSTHQLIRLIENEKRKEIERKKTKKKGLLFGYYIQHIYLYTERRTPKKLLLEMIKRFPNLQSIQGLKKDYNLSFTWQLLLFPPKQLVHFSYWYNDFGEHWIDLFIKNHSKIKTLDIIWHSNDFGSTSPSTVHFTTLLPIKKNCLVYTIQLPTLPCLTHLFLHCQSHDGDERMLESIHQSCPQLISLHLYNFKFHISDEYRIIHDYHQQQQQLKPFLSLKELNILGTIYDPACCYYLSFKYPNLESLSLSISVYLRETIPPFKMAYYHLITHYSSLKKLKVLLLCAGSKKIEWPHMELLEWLNHHPTQFSHLELPYYLSMKKTKRNMNDTTTTTIYESDYSYLEEPSHQSDATYYRGNDPNYEDEDEDEDEDDEDVRKHQKKEKEILNPNNPPLLLNSMIKNSPLPYPNYLNHLSSLTLHCSIYCLMDSFYSALSQDDNHSIILSNTIKELNLERFRTGNIFIWLDIFPNLKSLSIKGYSSVKSTVLDNDDDDIKFKNQVEDNQSYSLFMEKRKMQQQRIIANHYDVYKLKKIEIIDCKVNLKRNGWDGFFKKCPYLKIILLSNVNRRLFGYLKEYISSPGQHSTFDLSHLSLDLLKIQNVNCKPLIVDQEYKYDYIKELKITETSLNKEYYVGVNNETRPYSNALKTTATLHIICKYIDCLIFDNHKTYSNHVYNKQGGCIFI